jgi:chemotaxis protein CheX
VKSMTQLRPQVTVPFDPNWKAIMECAALEVFEMMANVRLTLNPNPTEAPTGGQTAMVGMAGALCGMTTIRCTRATAVRLAAHMLGEDAVSNPASARDALGELCNMVAGNFKAKISGLADACMLSVPTVIAGEDYSMDTAEPAEGVTIALVYEGENIWVTLVTHT